MRFGVLEAVLVESFTRILCMEQYFVGIGGVDVPRIEVERDARGLLRDLPEELDDEGARRRRKAAPADLQVGEAGLKYCCSDLVGRKSWLSL